MLDRTLLQQISENLRSAACHTELMCLMVLSAETQQSEVDYLLMLLKDINHLADKLKKQVENKQ